MNEKWYIYRNLLFVGEENELCDKKLIKKKDKYMNKEDEKEPIVDKTLERRVYMKRRDYNKLVNL